MTNRQAGFTLTELVVTVALVGTLGAAASIAITNRMPPAEVTSGKVANALGDLRVLARTDATPADAIAEGFPPDFRGRIAIKSQPCPGAAGSPYPIHNTDLGGFTCSSVSQYWEIKSERLRAGGGFDTIGIVNVGGNGRPAPPGGLKSFYSTPGASISSGIPCDGSACQTSSSSGLTAMNNALVAEKNPTVVPTTGHATLCYANGTCDPITYWFASSVGTEIKYSRVAITPTGSVVPLNSWGGL